MTFVLVHVQPNLNSVKDIWRFFWVPGTKFVPFVSKIFNKNNLKQKSYEDFSVLKTHNVFDDNKEYEITKKIVTFLKK